MNKTMNYEVTIPVNTKEEAIELACFLIKDNIPHEIRPVKVRNEKKTKYVVFREYATEESMVVYPKKYDKKSINCAKKIAQKESELTLEIFFKKRKK